MAESSYQSLPHPSFLENLSSVFAHTDTAPYAGTFKHRGESAMSRGVNTECLWYPPSVNVAVDGEKGVDESVTVLLFLPGNPGLIQFYTLFLSTIRKSHPTLGILAHAYLGHSPLLSLSRSPISHGDISNGSAALHVQLQSTLEVYDSIVREYSGLRGGVRIVLCGHSLGGWVCAQIMKARPNAVDGAFLLFPALHNLPSSPGGRQLRYILSHPSAIILSALSYVLFSILVPNSLLLYLLTKLFANWPRHQLYVLRDFLSSPRAIYSALRMGRDELRTITSLSSLDDTLKQEAKKIWVYFGDNDRWVPESSAKEVFQVLREAGGAKTKAEVVRRIGKSRFHANSDNAQTNESEWNDQVAGEVIFGTGIPHDFCINHDVVMGQLCAQWLFDGRLVVES